MKIYALSLAIGLMVARVAIAADGVKPPELGACTEVQTCGSPDCCAHCGCNGCCEKYCKVVCEMKEIKKTVWTVKCEDFCAPLPSCPLQCCKDCESCGKEGCEAACGDGGKCCDPCASIENRNYIPPKCGKVRVKKTLEKKEVTCKIPTYKCVVVYACASCGSKCGGDKVEPPNAPLPTPATKTTQVLPLPPVLPKLN